ncbi:MAG TPA: L,D-transpeptidase family protein [Vineibacter sp.]|nr:L,D-transpeptidase family protein [Vineibacter sp.]
MTVFRVAADSFSATRGHVTLADGDDVSCALGRGGVLTDKGEGDGATPLGTWTLRCVWYRADRLAAAPATVLPTRAIREDDGWCDDPRSPDYNRPVTLPHPARHERLWRNDAVYDVVVELGYNDDPPVPDRGSAIFLHVARPDYGPTEGCVALALNDLLRLLRACDGCDALHVMSPHTDRPVSGP